ncbi:GumC family protein [Novosphingobium soli]|uniref:non-specific protein-tyrosine kinase n=1 Tax=Novosphingobium soli TaxID=574956 RepID=A0ABV6CY08_9SPHN
MILPLPPQCDDTAPDPERIGVLRKQGGKRLNTSVVIPVPSAPLAAPLRPVPAPPAADRLDAGVLLAFLRRRWPLIVAVLLAALAVGLAVTLLQTPRYLATAQVALEPRAEPVAPLTEEDRMAARGTPGETYVDTQVAVMTSAHNVAAVVDRLGLARQARFAQGPGDARQAAIAYVEDGVSAFRSGATYAIGVGFESEDAGEAARIANAFAWQYTQGARLDRDAADARILAQVGLRMEQARRQAAADAALMQRYRLANDLPSTTDHSLAEQEISAYNQEVTAARAQAAEDAARLATARQQLGSGSSGEDLGDSLGSAVIAALRQQQAARAAEVAALASKYGPRHPHLLRARSELDAVNAGIAAEIGRVVSGLSAKAAVSQRRLGSLTGSLDASQQSLRRDNAAMVGLQEIEQRAQASRQLYESYLSRYKDLAARIGMRPPEARVLRPARPSQTPLHPDLLLNMTLSAALGLGLGLLCALAVDGASAGAARGLACGDDVENRLGLRHLGSIPELGSVLPRGVGDPVDAVLDHPRSALAEAFRNVHASIAFVVENPRVIAVTSALSGEGKTTLALCLARMMASTSGPILLIDCDLRRRAVSGWIGGARAAGLLEVLRGEARLEDVVATDARTGLSVLPLAAAKEEDHALLTGPAMDALLATAGQGYHAVILDTAPVLPVADARLLLCKADAAIIATRWRRTPEAALRALLRLLPEGAVTLAGVVLTRVDVRRQAAFGLDASAFYPACRDYYRA